MLESSSTKTLFRLAALYTVASLLHFTHNAEFLDAYPNLPTWISRTGVYVSWICVAAVGTFGYVLLRTGREAGGLVVLGLYACLGFDGLLHYQRATLEAHTFAMNATILFEVATAAVLLITVVRLGFRLSRTTPA